MQDGPEARSQAHAATLDRVATDREQGSEPRARDVAIDVLVNGASRSLPPGCTVQGLVDALGLERRRIAIAVNRDVVPRSRFGAHALSAGDHVEILEAVGGG